MDPYMPTMHEGEEIVMTLRRHIIILLVPLSVVFLLVVFPLVTLLILLQSFPFLWVAPSKNFIIILFSFYLLVLAAYSFYSWFCYYFTVIVITNHRIIELKQEGIFHRVTNELDLSRIEDVSGEIKGMIHTFLHYGTLTIETAGETPNFIFSDIASPNQIASKILELSEREEEKRQNDFAEKIIEEKNKNTTPNEVARNSGTESPGQEEILYKRPPSGEGP